MVLETMDIPWHEKSLTDIMYGASVTHLMWQKKEVLDILQVSAMITDPVPGLTLEKIK